MIHRIRRIVILACVLCIVVLSSRSVRADSVTIEATKDAAIFFGSPNTNYGNDNLVVGDVGGDWWSLIEWDIPGHIEGGSTIESVEIRLDQSCGSSYSDLFIDVAEILGAWSESNVTWSNRPGSSTSLS